MVRGDLEGTIRAKMDELRNVVEQLRAEKRTHGQDSIDRKAAIALDPSVGAGDLREVIRELRDSMQQYRRIILEQDGILAHIGSNPIASSSSSSSSAVNLAHAPSTSAAAAAVS